MNENYKRIRFLLGIVACVLSLLLYYCPNYARVCACMRVCDGVYRFSLSHRVYVCLNLVFMLFYSVAPASLDRVHFIKFNQCLNFNRGTCVLHVVVKVQTYIYFYSVRVFESKNVYFQICMNHTHTHTYMHVRSHFALVLSYFFFTLTLTHWLSCSLALALASLPKWIEEKCFFLSVHLGMVRVAFEERV